MGIRLFEEPELRKPDMILGWPGIGNIGIIAADTLRGQAQAREFGEIESWDFFYPKGLKVKAGMLEELEFPGNKFYYQRLKGKDLIFFIGEEQPTAPGRTYAEGGKAYQMANLVLDVAGRFGCQRVYTSGAAVALTHHTLKPKVWTVASRESLIEEMKGYSNTVLMSEIEGRGNQGSISGLNGLLPGLAKKRGFDAICLMGEIPDYLSQSPLPYPRAAKAVVEVLAGILGIRVDFTPFDTMAAQIDTVINSLYEKFPPEIKERIEQRKSAIQAKVETITEEDETWIKEHIDEFFKKKSGNE